MQRLALMAGGHLTLDAGGVLDINTPGAPTMTFAANSALGALSGITSTAVASVGQITIGGIGELFLNGISSVAAASIGSPPIYINRVVPNGITSAGTASFGSMTLGQIDALSPTGVSSTGPANVGGTIQYLALAGGGHLTLAGGGSLEIQSLAGAMTINQNQVLAPIGLSSAAVATFGAMPMTVVINLGAPSSIASAGVASVGQPLFTFNWLFPLAGISSADVAMVGQPTAFPPPNVTPSDIASADVALVGSPTFVRHIIQPLGGLTGITSTGVATVGQLTLYRVTFGIPAPPSFPALPGQKFPKRTPIWKGTRLIVAASGREVRGQNWAAPLQSFELSYDALCSDASNPGAGANSLQQIIELFDLCGGQYGTFIYNDPIDNAVSNQFIGIGTGALTTFTFQRSLRTYTAPVGWVTGLSAVYVNGVVQTTGVYISEPNTLVFASAPASGAVISADFTFAYVCRFDSDELEFEQFASGLHSAASIKFRSVRSS